MANDFTISIVSHGHTGLLPSLLGDIRQYVPDACVIVTLNIPEPFDTTRWPDVEFRHNPVPKGFGANHNSALQAAESEWLVIANPDIRLTPMAFPALREAIRRAPVVDLFAPKVVGPDGEVQDSARSLPTPIRVLRRAAARLTGRTPPPEPREWATWFAGMFLVVRRSAYAAVGGFDERFFLYGEDVALSVQLVAQGRRLQAVDDAVVIHDARRATLRSFQHLRWHVSSLLRLWTSPAFHLHERRHAELNRQC